jgi:hypothetical protein
MYEASKDQTLASKTVLETTDNRLTVSVCQYNGGEPKVTIQREVKTKAGAWKFAKLRRLTADEVLPVCEGLTWASTTLAAVQAA